MSLGEILATSPLAHNWSCGWVEQVTRVWCLCEGCAQARLGCWPAEPAHRCSAHRVDFRDVCLPRADGPVSCLYLSTSAPRFGGPHGEKEISVSGWTSHQGALTRSKACVRGWLWMPFLITDRTLRKSCFTEWQGVPPKCPSIHCVWRKLRCSNQKTWGF